MTETARPAPFFLAEDPALDFLNSTAVPWGSEIEWIADGNDLLAWLELAGLVPASVLAEFRKKATPAELDAVAARARDLRERFRAFVSGQAGEPAQPTVLADLAAINRLLAGDNSYRQLEAFDPPHHDGDGNRPALRWRQVRRWRSPDTLLLPIAEAMGDLVCRADFERVKKCESATCTLWFRDVSQNHTRRWCSMAVCGNRAKAAAHRARKKSAGERVRIR